MSKSSFRQIRLALIGPSGAGKSTTARLLQTTLQSRGLSCSVHKLATPLYDIKQMYYQAAGRVVAYEAQDHPLMEQIARSLRDLSPTSLVDNLTLRLAGCRDDVILNDDLRDDIVDLPALRRQGFRLIRIHAPETVLRERMIGRADLRLIEHSPLNAQLRRMRADYVLSNTTDLAQLQTQIDGLLDALTASVRKSTDASSILQPA
jgi:dephospho-CoA kinase